jgi:hypothetical protein
MEVLHDVESHPDIQADEKTFGLFNSCLAIPNWKAPRDTLESRLTTHSRYPSKLRSKLVTSGRRRHPFDNVRAAAIWRDVVRVQPANSGLPIPLPLTGIYVGKAVVRAGDPAGKCAALSD